MSQALIFKPTNFNVFVSLHCKLFMFKSKEVTYKHKQDRPSTPVRSCFKEKRLPISAIVPGLGNPTVEFRTKTKNLRRQYL